MMMVMTVRLPYSADDGDGDDGDDGDDADDGDDGDDGIRDSNSNEVVK